MLNAVIRLSLRYRTLVIVLTLAVLVYGSYLATTTADRRVPRPRPAARGHPHRVPRPGAGGGRDAGHAADRDRPARGDRRAGRAQPVQPGLNVIYVEFDWTTEIRAARQTVQERLATLAGVLPEGIRPQMTPPASIMGQIVLAGMYRQQRAAGRRPGPGRQDRATGRTDRTTGGERSR